MGYTGEKKREYQREWRQRRRQEWIEEHGPCTDCGDSEELEVDHQDATTKLMAPAALWSMSPRNPKRITELAKCVVRCHKCHVIKTSDKKDQPRAKLTYEAAAEIRQRYSAGGETYRSLAVEFGVVHQAISDIIRGKTYKAG